MDTVNCKTLPKLGIADKLSLVHLYVVKFHTHRIFRRLMNNEYKNDFLLTLVSRIGLDNSTILNSRGL